MKGLPRIRESEFQDQVLELAFLEGWLRAHFRPVRIQRKDGSVYYETPVQADGAGFLDLVLVRDTELIFAELKVHPNQPTREQQKWINALRKTGADVRIWTHPHSWPEIEQTLRRR